MPDKPLQVYISSTFVDLRDFRQAVYDSIVQVGACPVVLEQFGASADPPLDVCRAAVQGSDVMVLIVGHRYGAVLHGGVKSVTEFEFEAARASGIPVLAFILDDDCPWPPQLSISANRRHN
jgi:Domain of unknown function (DUF4062)